MLVFQIIVTVWIILNILQEMYSLFSLDGNEYETGHKIAVIFALVLQFGIFFVILCFVWNWFGF